MSIELKCVEPGHTDKRWLLKLNGSAAVLTTASGEEVARFSPRDAQDRFRFPGLAAGERHFGIVFDEQTVRFDVQPRDLHAIEKFLMPGAAESVPLSIQPKAQARVGTTARAAAKTPSVRSARPAPEAPAPTAHPTHAGHPAVMTIGDDDDWSPSPVSATRPKPAGPKIISISNVDEPIELESAHGPLIPRPVPLVLGTLALIYAIGQAIWLVQRFSSGFTHPAQPIGGGVGVVAGFLIMFVFYRRGKADSIDETF